MPALLALQQGRQAPQVLRREQIASAVPEQRELLGLELRALPLVQPEQELVPVRRASEQERPVPAEPVQQA